MLFSTVAATAVTTATMTAMLLLVAVVAVPVASVLLAVCIVFGVAHSAVFRSGLWTLTSHGGVWRTLTRRA